MDKIHHCVSCITKEAEDKKTLTEATYIEWLKKRGRCIYCDGYRVNEGADEEDFICKHCNGTGKTNEEEI